jgi:hypothetical protein
MTNSDERRDPDEAMRNLDKLTDKLFSVREDDGETVVEETETEPVEDED